MLELTKEDQHEDNKGVLTQIHQEVAMPWSRNSNLLKPEDVAITMIKADCHELLKSS